MIFIACDHGGVELKNAIISMLKESGTAFNDLGTCDTQSVDYPDYGIAAAEHVASTPNSKGIVICKTGVGMSICANKVKGIRCALCITPEMAHLCREHNNANVLALGAANTSLSVALEIVKEFLSADFAAGRHAQRVDKITAYENR